MYIRRSNLNVAVQYLFVITFILAFVFVPNKEENIKATNLVLVLDPGHGGSDPGAVYYYDGIPIKEAELDMKIALAVRQELLKYEGVSVFLTREDNSKYLTLDERVNIASSLNADAIISIHNNASTNQQAHGAEVMVPSGNDGSGLHLISKALGDSILDELTNLGIHRRGLMQRISSTYKYKNGKPADYYGIIRHSMNNSLPGIIVECAFLSNENDYRTFLNTDEKLEKIGQAVGRGIANYYGLIEGDNQMNSLGDLNQDTFISAYDAYLLNKQIGLGQVGDAAISDVNSDGVVNILDVKEILEFSAGLRNDFSGGVTRAILKPGQVAMGIIMTQDDDPYLNVRTGPGVSYPAIGAYNKGTYIYITSGLGDKWCYARGICVFSGRIIEGYSSMAYIDVIEKEVEDTDFEVQISGPSISLSNDEVTSGCIAIQFNSDHIEIESIETDMEYVTTFGESGVLKIYFINSSNLSDTINICFASMDSSVDKADVTLSFAELTDIEGKELTTEPETITLTFAEPMPFDLEIKDSYVYGFECGFTVGEILEKCKVVEEVFLENGENAQEDTLLATGMKVSMDASVYIVVIFGDVNGDGIVDICDIESIQKHLLEASVLDGAYYNAADINCDSAINALDIGACQKFIYESSP